MLKTLNVITELEYDEPKLNWNRETRSTTEGDERQSTSNGLLDRRRLRFITEKTKGRWKNKDRSTLVDFILRRVVGRGVEAATVHGKNANGEDLPPIHISPEVDSFAAYKYNDVVAEENMTLDNIAKVPFIGQIISVANANKGYFETEAGP